MKKLPLIFFLAVFFLYVNDVYSQTPVVIDISGYKEGFFAIVLEDNEFQNDTVAINRCGIVHCNYPYARSVEEQNFSFVLVEGPETTSIPNFLDDRVKEPHHGIYYRPGFLSAVRGKKVIINHIGTIKEMQLEIEIDSPVFDKLLERINKECN